MWVNFKFLNTILTPSRHVFCPQSREPPVYQSSLMKKGIYNFIIHCIPHVSVASLSLWLSLLIKTTVSTFHQICNPQRRPGATYVCHRDDQVAWWQSVKFEPLLSRWSRAAVFILSLFFSQRWWRTDISVTLSSFRPVSVTHNTFALVFIYASRVNSTTFYSVCYKKKKKLIQL